MVISRTNAVLLVGPTASGKSPLGDLIARKGIHGIRCHHFDFGEELRRLASGKAGGEFTRDDVRFVRAVIEEGILLEDEHFPLASKIIDSFISRRTEVPGDLIVLNGFPRHRGQAEQMKDIIQVRAVFVLECGEETILGRIRDNTGGDRTGREDDHKDLVMKKITIYRERTFPLVSFYRDQGADIISLCIGAEARTSDIFRELLLRYPPNQLTTE